MREKYNLGERCPYGNCENVIGFDFEQCKCYILHRNNRYAPASVEHIGAGVLSNGI